MNIPESGILSGIAAGAIVGGVLCKVLVPGVVGGMVSGAVVGWLYSYFVICLLSIIGPLWQAARKRPDAVPTNTDMPTITQIGVRGTFLGILGALVCWLSFGLLSALMAAFAIGAATALIAVGKCEFR